MVSSPRWSSSPTPRSTASRSARPGTDGRGKPLHYFLLGTGAFLALYLPQPLLPDLDRDFGTSPTVTGLVMTGALLGFAVGGLLREGEPHRTLRLAMWLVVVASVVAAAGPSIWVLIPARAGQGVGIGLMIAGALADVPRRLPPAEAGRLTGAVISGTAVGGLLGRVVGYSGLFLGWRGAFLLGGAGALAVCGYSLSRLARRAAGAGPPRVVASGRAPLSITLAGLFILFVSVGLFDLLPYRITGAPFHVPPVLGDLVYLVFVPAAFAGLWAGRAIDRFGARAVIVVAALAEIALLLIGLLPSIPALVVAAAGGICGTVALHVAHSGWAARHGRVAVGRYLAMYYLGGAAAAPICAYGYGRFGWPGVVIPLVAVTAAVLVLALARQEPDGAQRQQVDARVPPPGAAG
jgi:MFS transporter, YNFM family, putative membrane transport protein